MTTLNSRHQLAVLNHKKGRNLIEKGFTLVELMIVIVIVGILSSVALPNFLNQTSKAKATECTTKAGSILSAYGADALGDKTEALATAVQSAADSTLCDFTDPTATSAGVMSIVVVGKGEIDGNYFANGCVNSVTGSKKLVTSTKEAPGAQTCS